MVRRRVPGAFLAVLGLLAAGCGDARSSATPAKAAGGSWTLLHYAMADTDLEPFMMDDLEELGEVQQTDDFNAVALVDRAAGHSDEPVLGLAPWEGARVLHLNGTGQGAEVLEDLGDVDTGDPAVLAAFIAAGIAAYPADHYALVISDHGGGWVGVGGDESANGDLLSLAELRQALRTGLARADVDELDLLGFDACLMATYEVAASVEGTSRVMLASEETEPGHGWDYRRFQVLADAPSTGPTKLGKALIRGYEAQAARAGNDSSITLSLLDLHELDAVTDALDRFVDKAEGQMTDLAPTVGHERWRNLSFGRSPDPSQDSFHTDLAELAARIGADAPTDVAAAAEQLTDALDALVVGQVTGTTTERASGLSIYFPLQAQLAAEGYADVATASTWRNFLGSYLSAGRAIPESQRPRFTDAGGQAQVDRDRAGNLVVTGTFDPRSGEGLTQATIDYGVIGADGTVTFIGNQPATIEDGTITGTYDQTALAMTDGDNTIYAFLQLTERPDDEIIEAAVPLAYLAPGTTGGYLDVVLSLTLDGEGRPLNEVYYAFYGDGTSGEFTPDPGGTIVPKLLYLHPDGTQDWLPTNDTPIRADLESIRYGVDQLAEGTPLGLVLTMVDYGGNFAQVTAEATAVG